MIKFDDLKLNPKILQAVAQAGYTEPTDIQAKAIPAILEGSDVRIFAETGSGKTAAFVLPALNKLTENGNGHGPRILVLVPTRELAMQVAAQAEKYSKFMKRVQTVCIIGGVSYHIQKRKMSRPYDILIATPGRLLDYMERGAIDFSGVEMLVLDEADRMLDMGFIDDVERIGDALPEDRQTLLFSATLQGSIIKLAKRLMKDSVEIASASATKKHENIEQKLFYADDLFHKKKMLLHFLEDLGEGTAIVFTATKMHASKLVDELFEAGYKADALHGDMTQNKRTRTIEKMRSGRVQVLVATDVASRGIDVQSISHVINFDLPRNVEDYIHRIGRTGRAGAKGLALSLVSAHEVSFVRRLEEYNKQPIEMQVVAGLEPKSKPGSGSRGGPRGGRFGGGDRRPGRFGGDRRPSRFGGEERRPSRDADSRPPRFDFDRKPRRFDSDSRPPRFDSDRKPGRFGGDSRPPRFDSDRKPARFNSDSRPPRFDSDKRPSGFGSDRKYSTPNTRFGADKKPGRFGGRKKSFKD